MSETTIISVAGTTYTCSPEDVEIGQKISGRTYEGLVRDVPCIVKQVYGVDGSVVARDIEMFSKAHALGVGPMIHIIYMKNDTVYFVMQKFTVPLSRLITLQRGMLVKQQVVQLVDMLKTLVDNNVNFKIISHTKVFWVEGRFCLVDFCFPNVCDRFNADDRENFVYKHAHALLMYTANQRDLHLFLRKHAYETGLLRTVGSDPDLSVSKAFIAQEQRRRFKRFGTSAF